MLWSSLVDDQQHPSHCKKKCPSYVTLFTAADGRRIRPWLLSTVLDEIIIVLMRKLEEEAWAYCIVVVRREEECGRWLGKVEIDTTKNSSLGYLSKGYLDEAPLVYHLSKWYDITLDSLPLLISYHTISIIRRSILISSEVSSKLTYVSCTEVSSAFGVGGWRICWYHHTLKSRRNTNTYTALVFPI